MKKRLIFALVMVCILAVSIVAACAKPAPTVTPTTPTQPTTPAPPAPPKVVELTMNDHNPPPSGPAKSNAYWAEQCMAQSNGSLKINIVPGAALFTGDEIFRAIQTKACPLGMYVPDERDGFYLSMVTSLPFAGWKKNHYEKELMALYNKFPEMKGEWDGVEILGMFIMPGSNIANTKRAVKTPADLKGLKILGAEDMMNKTMEAAGATPVQLDITDMTPSLNSKLIDGIMNHFNVMMIFGALELMQYPTIFGAGINATPAYIIGNTEMINALPADIQKILRGNSDTWNKKFTELTDQESGAARKIVESKTLTILTDAEYKVWQDLIKDKVHKEWIATGAAKGLPAQAVYDEMIKLIASQ